MKILIYAEIVVQIPGLQRLPNESIVKNRITLTKSARNTAVKGFEIAGPSGHRDET